MDPSQFGKSGASEYELYGHYATSVHPNKVVMWRECRVLHMETLDFPTNAKELNLDTVAFPAFLRKALL